MVPSTLARESWTLGGPPSIEDEQAQGLVDGRNNTIIEIVRWQVPFVCYRFFPAVCCRVERPMFIFLIGVTVLLLFPTRVVGRAVAALSTKQ